MSDWVVETPTFEEDLMNNRIILLNQKGVNEVVEIIKNKDKEINRLNNILDEIEKTIIDNIKYSDEYRCKISKIFLKKIRLLRVGKGGFTHE